MYLFRVIPHISVFVKSKKKKERANNTSKDYCQKSLTTRSKTCCNTRLKARFAVLLVKIKVV